MAAPNSIICIDNNEITINFSGQSLTEGTFISVVQTIPPTSADVYTCVEITGADDPTSGPAYTATSETYTSCYDCLVNNNTVVVLEPCDSSIPFTPNFDISELGFIPTENQVFYLQITVPPGRDEGVYTSCFQFTGNIQQYSSVDYTGITLCTIDELIFSNYDTCDECLYGFSAGTESTICVICCPCTTGETITSVSAPHPTWTNGQGQAVTLLDAITLGGPNGLNN
jgi:hypothetical protein